MSFFSAKGDMDLLLRGKERKSAKVNGLDVVLLLSFPRLPARAVFRRFIPTQELCIWNQQVSL